MRHLSAAVVTIALAGLLAGPSSGDEDSDLWVVENDKSVITAVVHETLANIQTDYGKKKRLPLQQKIAEVIKSKRGNEPRNMNSYYAISLGMRFSKTHPNQKQPIDVDNYIKPIFAGIATGLFVDKEEIPTDPEKFRHYDDSHFDYLFVERLDNKKNEEGVAIVISEKS